MPLNPFLRGFDFRDEPWGHRIQGARPYQEDNFGIWQDRDGRLVMLVADGLGGHRGGAEASRTAVELFYAAFEAGEGDLGARMKTAVQIANNAIGLKSLSEDRFFGMGCTLVACVLARDEVHWISVGDSPLWRVSAQAPGIERLNEDHSMKAVASRRLREGRITAEEAASYNPNELTSALVGDRIAHLDQRSAPLASGDWLLLASDGLETLPESEIEGVCREQPHPLETGKELLARVEAAEKEGQDNATVVVYRHP